MWHVTGSVQAFLLDMEAGEMLPVVMTDGSWTERRYALGKRRVEYTLGCRLAQEEIRR